MRAKTDANLEAANFLISRENGKHCNASIHCSYYAVLQYLKYILNNLKDNPIPYDDQKERGGQSSHDFIQSQIKARLADCSSAELRNYSNDFNSIKRHRVEADYGSTTFQVEDCLTCRDVAERLIRFLKSKFNNKIAS